MNKEHLSDMLKMHNLKVTSARVNVLDIFYNTEKHLTADEVYLTLSNNNIRMGITTIYRVLNQLVENNLLDRNFFKNGIACYEIAKSHHDHLVCIDCNHVFEFHDEEIEKLQEKVAMAHHLKLKSHNLNLYAKCNLDNCPRNLKFRKNI